MKRVQLLLFGLYAIALSGCYSIARYEATVRPATVKPRASVTGKYRLERILLHKNTLIGIPKDVYVEGRLWYEASAAFRKNKTLKKSYADKARLEVNPHELLNKIEDPKSFDVFAHEYINEFPFLYGAIIQKSQEYHVAVETNDLESKAKIVKEIVEGYCDNLACKKLANDYKKSNNAYMHETSFNSDYNRLTKLNRSKACNKMVFDAVQASLLKNYPKIFTTSGDATPVTVLVTFENKFEMHHPVASILVLGPYSQELEVTYRIRVVPSVAGQSLDELWKDYVASQLDYPPNAHNSNAVRVRTMWSSLLFPITLFGMPGNSDWPKKRYAFKSSTSSFTINKENHDRDIVYLSSEEYMKKYIFDSVCDGDIIAALIIRSLNKMTETE